MLIRVGSTGPSQAQLKRARRKAAILRNPLGPDAPIATTNSAGELVAPTGPGLTEPIGRRAGEMMDILSDPTNIRQLYGDRPFRQAAMRRAELDAVGARGKYTGCPGLSRGGEMQYMGRMPLSLFYWQIGTDPTLFQDDKRLERHLKKMELANAV